MTKLQLLILARCCW